MTQFVLSQPFHCHAMQAVACLTAALLSIVILSISTMEYI